MTVELITEDWLRSVGFKWHQLDRQPTKHWLLWLGSAITRLHHLCDTEDLGIELAPGHNDPFWYCWLRSDTAGRYHRYLHVRHLIQKVELIRLVEGLTNLPWNTDNHMYGCVYTAEGAAYRRTEAERFDLQLREDMPKWHDIEKDPSAGRPLPEHQRGYMDDRKGK
jgi:hypothetical protein